MTRYRNLDSADVRLVINTLFAVIRDGIAETNCRYSLGDVVFESAISGSLPAMDSSLTAENALYVLITIGDALRQKVAALVLTHDTTDVAKVRITDIMDVATVITEGGSGGASHTHNLELLEADATHWILKMPTEVASYNMPTLGDFTFTMHGGVAGSAAQTVTKNDISIAF